MRLCDYHSYCPSGADSIPYGGYKEDGSLAPFINGRDRWVGLGADAKCKEYLFFYPPGITSIDNEETTKHILCCSHSNVTAAVFTDEETPSTSSLSSPLSGKAGQLADLVDDEFKAVYKMFSDRLDKSLKPIPHNRFSGWTGHTYSEALEFCSSRESGSKGLCPYESLCPNGTGEEQPGIRFLDGLLYVPIEGRVDTWVEIRDQGQCKAVTNLPYGQDVTRYVLCCKIEGEASSGAKP